MELDEFRRRWQQTPPTADLTETSLKQLLKHRSTSLVEKMRRNARLEAGLTVLVIMLLPAYIVYTDIVYADKLPLQLWGKFMLVLAVGMLYYYYLKLGLLQRMAHAETQVRQHLSQLCAGLRQLLRFYYRLTLATGPFVLLMGLCFAVSKEYAHSRLTPGYVVDWEALGIMAAVMLVGGALLQVGTVYGTRWYLQRLYGQHLDRLEASLRELGDEPLA